jgi:hypothetical protein
MSRNKTRIESLAICAALLAAGITGACTAEQRHEYLAHSDTQTLDAGDAVAANKATHTINPWPAASQKTQIDMDGKRAQIAGRRYETNTSIKPKGLANGDATYSNGNSGGSAVKN